MVNTHIALIFQVFEKSATMRYMREFEKKYPEIAKKYFDLKYPQYYI